MRSLSLRDHTIRALGAGLFVALCASVVLAAERSLQSRQDIAGLQARRQREALRQLDAIEAGKGRTDSLVKVYREAVLPSTDWDAAIADLARSIRALLSQHGATMESVSPMPRDTTIMTALKPAAVRVSCRGDLDAVVALLRYLEESQTMLVLRSIQVSSSSPFAEHSAPEVLTIDFVATGWYIGQ